MRFYAKVKTEYSNGAIGYAPGGPMDCLGPFARVTNCPVMVGGVEVCRLACYATGYPSGFFSVPACTRRKGRHVGGYFTGVDTQANDGTWSRGIEFRVAGRFRHLFE